GNGSRTAKRKKGASHGTAWKAAGSGFADCACIIMAAPVRILRIQAVDPNPVEMMMPLEDCVSLKSLSAISYRADVCVFGPTNKSLTAYNCCPSERAACAMVTDLTVLRRAMTSGRIEVISFGANGNSTPSKRRGSGFTPTKGWPLRYFMVLATKPSCPKATTTSSGPNRKLGKNERSMACTRQ